MNTSSHNKKWMSLLTAAMLTLSVGNALADEPADIAEDTAKENLDPKNNPAKDVKDKHPVGTFIYNVINKGLEELRKENKSKEDQDSSKGGSKNR